MVWPAVIAAGGALLGGAISAKGASDAGKAAAQASDRAAEVQLQIAQENNALARQMYDQQRKDTAFQRQVGHHALDRLVDYSIPRRPSNFKADPGYNFAKREGLNAIDAGASARGMRLSGAALKDRANYATGLADQTYGNWWNREIGLDTDKFNRTASLAGMGQVATQAASNAGNALTSSVTGTNLATAGNVGNALMQGGAARGSAYQGVANAFSGALGGIGQTIGMAQSGALGPNPGFGIAPNPAGLNAWGYS